MLFSLTYWSLLYQFKELERNYSLKTQKDGKAAEEKALEYLQKQNHQLVMRNYNCRLGEIDLVMRDGSCLVFVEVRSRTNPGYGSGIESITFAKKKKIIKSASHFIMKYNLENQCPIRFDVVSIDGRQGSMTWLKDAFGADY